MSRTRLHHGKRWFSIEHGFTSHPKTVLAGDAAALLFIAGLDYCGERLTDGKIPKGMVPRLTSHRGPMALAAKLVEVGYWHDRGDHYESHEYLARYPSKAKVEADLEKDRTRKRNPGGTETDSATDSGRNDNGVHPEEGRIEVEEEVKTPRRPPAGGDWPGFEAFWTAYPWHLGKQAARRAWDKLKPDATLQSVLFCALTWQTRSGCLAPRTASDGRPVQLHAATWLNGRRWEDEPPPATREAEPDGAYVNILGRGKVPLDQAKREGLL